MTLTEPLGQTGVCEGGAGVSGVVRGGVGCEGRRGAWVLCLCEYLEVLVCVKVWMCVRACVPLLKLQLFAGIVVVHPVIPSERVWGDRKWTVMVLSEGHQTGSGLSWCSLRGVRQEVDCHGAL